MERSKTESEVEGAEDQVIIGLEKDFVWREVRL